MARTKADRKREVSGIVYLAFALLLAIAFYLPAGLTGWIGKSATMLFHGIIGVVSYIFPLFFLYLAIESFKEKRNAIRRQRYTYTLVAVICLSALLHVFTVDMDVFRALFSPGGSHASDRPALAALKALWDIGVDPSLFPELGRPLSGGIAGGLAATALHAVGGRVGAPLLLISVVIIQVILIFDVSIRHAVGTTTRALHKTGARMNDALRERVRLLRERAAQNSVSVEPNYDHRLTDKAEEPELFVDESFEDASGFLPEILFSPIPDTIHGTPDPAETAAGTEAEQAQDRIPAAHVGLPAGIVHIGLPGAHSDALGKETKATPQDAAKKADSANGPADANPSGNPEERPYQSPPPSLLNPGRTANAAANAISVNALGRKLEETLASFGIAAKVSNITSGPSITRFELIPGPGIKVSRIVSLTDDIALNLAAAGVRIEAPIPGKSAIGVEIPNKETVPVSLRGLIESPEYRTFPSQLAVVLGRDIAGQPILCDITRMPHLMIAGATGSGKSVCINAILMSILFRAHPDEVKMILIDPKIVELSVYNGIPHLLVPVVTDPKKAANALIWAVNEMNHRYRLFSERAVRDITAYNEAASEGEFERLPLILIIIDELADLMATSPTEVEDAIARLTAMARAAGIHLIIATQRPSVDVITGVIKANIPSRIAFAVASQVDSRTILDMAGAEKLLGKGDLLYFPQSSPKPIRGQGAMVTDAEVETVTAFLKAQNQKGYDQSTSESVVATPMSGAGRESHDADELLPSAVDIVIDAGYASVSLLQRRMNVGYPRAARLIDRMQEAGYVGPFEGSKPRKVIISKQRWMEIQSAAEGS